MFKKIIILISVSIISIWYTFADYFTTFPWLGFSSYYKTNNNHKTIKYQKNSINYNNLDFSNYPFSTITKSKLDLSWKSCFYRSSYYWKNTFKNIRNNNINLSYLDSHKLNKKIIWFEYYWTLVYFVHKNLIKKYDQKIIWDKYLSSKFNIVKKENYYMIATKKNASCRSYYSINELINIDKSVSYNKILTLQVGNNPYDKYSFKKNSLNNYFLQLEFIKNKKLKGYIIWLFKLNELYPYPTYYNKDYYKDIGMKWKLLGLINSVESYYEDMWGLPDSINSMYPNWVWDEFIGHSYDVKYEIIDEECFKVSFKPKNYKFKEIYKFEMNGDWRGYKYCIR